MAKVFKTYGEKLRDPRWQIKRLNIFNRDKSTCQLCGDKDLEKHVHHLKYAGNPWDVPDEYLQLLCCDCHQIVSKCDYDLLTDFIRVRRLVRAGCVLLFVVSSEGLRLYMKSGNELKDVFAFSHDSLHHLVHAAIDYWLLSDNGHLLTDKKIATQSNTLPNA